MPILTPALAEAIWARAAESEIGLGITLTAGRPETFINTLYEARPGDKWQNLQICRPANGEIFIIRKTVDLD